MSNNRVLGADIGGSHISASLVDVSGGHTAPDHIVRQEVDSAADAASVIGQWAGVIRQCFNGMPSSRKLIGIAMPGPVDYEKGICYIRDQHKYEHLYGLNLKELLAGALGIEVSQIRLINDAAGFLAGELFSGAAQGHRAAIGLTLGTGLGSAIFKNGKVSDAELWQSAFRGGRAEDYLAGPWILRQARTRTGRPFDSVRQVAAETAGDSILQELFSDFGNSLAEFLVPQLAMHQPTVLVLGGNISKAIDLFLPALTAGIAGQWPSLKIVPAVIGESAALMGAASLWTNEAVG